MDEIDCYRNSPVNKVIFKGRELYVKRDDLLSRDFSGNKARKLEYLFDKDLSEYKAIVSYGSSQSNAMYSLSVLAKQKDIPFVYFSHNISSYLKSNIKGNLRASLNNFMQIKESANPQKDAISFCKTDKYLYIPEGIATSGVSKGIKALADEIDDYATQNKLKNLSLFIPSGTGTSALYLQKYSNFEVYTTPCVGDVDYLTKQFLNLEPDNHPKVLPLPKKYHFGKLYIEFYEMYQKLNKDFKIEFDLLYDPKGWMVVEEYLDTFDGDLMYIHCGGLLGNETMLKRYERFLKV